MTSGCNLVLLLGISAGIPILSQTAPSRFEAASIKPHVANSGFAETSCSNGRLISQGAPLFEPIAWAYDLKGDAARELLAHSPSIAQKYYDFQAVAGPPVTEAECRLMMQALLAERFKLAVHWESRSAEGSDLVVAKGGPKIRKLSETDEGTDVNIVVNGRPLSQLPPLEPEPKGWSMERFAEFLTGRRDFQPIVDKTRLEGRYKIELLYSDLRLARANADVSAPELEAALAQQLGLRLEKHKGSVNVLVLDRLETPTPN